jgi:hypothetical protein
MADQETNGSTGTSTLASTTTEVVTQIARSAAGELVKGGQPIGDVVRTVAGDAMETIDRRGPELTEEAGIMNWRYAALGWITWQVGKVIVKRKAKGAFRSMNPTASKSQGDQ